MIGRITVLIQILLQSIGTSATSTERLMDEQKRWYSNNLSQIKSVIFPSQKKITGDLEENVKEYIKTYVEPIFKGCKNNFKPMNSNTQYSFIEQFTALTFDIKKTIEMLGKQLGKIPTPTDDDFIKSRKIELVSLKEIYRILIDTKAVPNIKIGNNVALSFNGVVKYMFYSLYLLLGEKKFNESQEIKQLANVVRKVRGELNETLKGLYKDEKFVKKVDAECYQKMDDIRFLFNKEFRDFETFLTTVTFVGDKERLYFNFYSAMRILNSMTFAMNNYIISLTASEETEYYIDFSNNFEEMICGMLFFSIPKSKIPDFISAVGNNITLSDFSIFDGDFDRDAVDNWPGIDTLIGECIDPVSKSSGYKISTIVFVIGGVILLFLFAGALIYYFMRKNKNTP